MAWTNTERALLAILVASLLVAGGAVAQSYLLTAGHGGTFDNPDGPAVTLGADYGISGDNPFGTDGSVTIQDTTIDGPAGSSVTLTDPSSANPTISSIDTAGGTVEADTAGIQTVGVEGSITSLSYRDVDHSDGQTTEFDVEGTGTLHVHGFSADEWLVVQYADGSSELVQADGSGVAAISVDDGDELTLVDDGGGPTLTDANPESGTFSSPPVDLSVNVTDPDFGTSNEEVTLEWYVDGTLEGTTTVTENGTATIESPVDEGGTHDWYVTAADTTGASDRAPTSGNYTYSLPNELRLYEETSPDTLIDTDQANVTVRFFTDEGDEVIERQPDGGVVDLQGLPTNQEFIVTVDAAGYHYRRIIIDSLLEQSDVFLLPENESASSVIFQLNDQTGEFDSATTRLYVERALNQSGETRYRVIAGDRFGASGEFPVELQDAERYRVRVENDDGQIRTLGAYTVSGDARAPLPIGQIDIDSDIEQGIAFGARLDDTEGGRVARLDYYDPETATSELALSLVRVDGGSETVVMNDTITNPGSRHLGTYPIPVSHPENATYEARYVAERDGDTLSGVRRIGSVEEIADQFGVDAWLLELLGYIAILAVIGLVAVVSPAVAALAGVAVAAILSVAGVVAIPGPFIGVAGVIAVMYNVARAKRVR